MPITYSFTKTNGLIICTVVGTGGTTPKQDPSISKPYHELKTISKTKRGLLLIKFTDVEYEINPAVDTTTLATTTYAAGANIDTVKTAFDASDVFYPL